MKVSLRQLLGVGGAILAIALLAWFLWPAAEPEKEASASAKPPPPRTAPASIAPQGDVDPVVAEARARAATPEDQILEELGIDKSVTPNCAQINVWNYRGASLMTITENMKDGGMMFDEKELACLTASPVPPGVLDVADAHVKRPVPPGASNGPMPKRLDDPNMAVPRVPGERTKPH
jgi:hypothetical protein